MLIFSGEDISLDFRGKIVLRDFGLVRLLFSLLMREEHVAIRTRLDVVEVYYDLLD